MTTLYDATSSNQTLPDGTIILDVTAASTGTGQFQPIVGIQAKGTEEGYNTDGTPLPLNDKSTASVHTGSVQLGSVPLVNADGTLWTGTGTAYREFQLDLNQSGGTNNKISLDA